MNITDEMVEAATRAIHDMDCDTEVCVGPTIEGRYGRWARAAVEAALREATESEEEWALAYTLDGLEREPGSGGHVFDSREQAQQHIDAWRQHYPSMTYSDVRFMRRTTWTGPWVDAGREDA